MNKRRIGYIQKKAYYSNCYTKATVFLVIMKKKKKNKNNFDYCGSRER